MRQDRAAASPLVVIATFVLLAVGVTVLVVFLVTDTTGLELQQVESGFEVVRVDGRLDWDALEVRLLDRAGVDRADWYLETPSGQVAQGDRIDLDPRLPAGRYVLVVMADSEELARLAVET